MPRVLPRGACNTWRHATKETPIQAQQETQMGMPVEIGLGDEDRERSSEDEEENKWGFPKSWPTYRTAAAVMGGIFQQRRSGEPPDKRTLLSFAWKKSSLSTFAAGLRKLGRRHTAAPNKSEWKILEEQLQEEMAIGRSPGTIKTAMSGHVGGVHGDRRASCPEVFLEIRQRGGECMR